MTRNARFAAFARSLVAVIRDEQLTFLAAAIAYYAFVSIIPLLLVTLAAGSAIAGETIATQILVVLEEFLTPQAATVIETALVSDTGRGGATVIGLAVLLWSSLRVFRGLDIAFSRVYGAEAPLGLVEQVRDALLVLGAMGLGLGMTVLLGTALPLSDLPRAEYLGPLGLVAVLSVVFLPVYYVFPDSRVSFWEAVPGAIFAGGGWTLLSLLFSLYASRAAAFQLYGIIGAVLLLLTWFYFGGLLVLLGAALNAVLAGQKDRQLQQGSLRKSRQPMSDSDESPDDTAEETSGVSTVESEPVDHGDLAEIRRELDRFEEEIDDRTVHREELEADLQQYVRRRVRRGHARDWGPYIVLLYGTAMTVGAFYFLDGGWAILAMLVVWLSTLGLYTLMVLVGATLNAAGLSGRALELLRNLR
ncbi:YihY/virulence factor BrkB family protein [Salinibaculum rarum]|uniref:YihY/virulence factor BrkB family protein n=1 Tax=Salinibaculum rarum TaxID=3058903 RepID=UPI0026600E29|nr:YihY/virulence factor BrkB family protein [Salinibaculum sp. KK48]